MSITAITATAKCQRSLRFAIDSVYEFVPNAPIRIFMHQVVRNRCPLRSGSQWNVTWHDIRPYNASVNLYGQYDHRYWYSVFMTDPHLWKSISTPFVLVFQADTLVCRPLNLKEIMKKNYDYIGGPTLRYGSRKTSIPRNILDFEMRRETSDCFFE